MANIAQIEKQKKLDHNKKILLQMKARGRR